MVISEGEPILLLIKDDSGTLLNDILVETTIETVDIPILVKNISNRKVKGIKLDGPKGVSLLNGSQEINPGSPPIQIIIRFEKNKSFSGNIRLTPIVVDINL